MFQIQSVRNLNRGKVSLLAIDDNLSVTASDTMPLISIRLSDIRCNLFTMKLFYQKKKHLLSPLLFQKGQPQIQTRPEIALKMKTVGSCVA